MKVVVLVDIGIIKENKMKTFLYWTGMILLFIVLFVLILALALALIALVIAIPAGLFWLVWTKLGVGAMIVGLPVYWQTLPFLHIWGMMLAISIVKGIIFPNPTAQEKLNVIGKEFKKLSNKEISFKEFMNNVNQS